jgi:hypothetical protein
MQAPIAYKIGDVVLFIGGPPCRSPWHHPGPP